MIYLVPILCVAILLGWPVAAMAQSEQTAILHLNVYPMDGHVYIESESRVCEPLQCTGWCTLELEPDRYLLSGGFHHDDLDEESEPLILHPGTENIVVVHIEERTTFDYLGQGTLIVGLLSLITGVVISVKRHGWKYPASIRKEHSVSIDPVITTFFSVGAVSPFLGILFFVLSSTPRVDFEVL